MKQEEKELLLKDLCARLPYKIMVKVNDTQGIMDEIDIPNERIFVSSLNPFLYGGAKASWFTVNGDKIYPYLRPLSSMTDEEKTELFQLMGNGTDIQRIDFYLSHYFDFRCLIPMGIALEAKEGMYKI